MTSLINYLFSDSLVKRDGGTAVAGKYSYDKSGEIRGKRTLEWFEKHVFCHEYWKSINGSVLDIGAGNGRMNKMYKDVFDELYSIDSGFDISSHFDYDNATHYRIGFEEFKTDMKFDVIVFMGSFYLMNNKDKTIQKCRELLKNTGNLIILEGLQQLKEETSNLCYTVEKLNNWCKNYDMSIRFSEPVDVNSKQQSEFIVIEVDK